MSITDTLGAYAYITSSPVYSIVLAGTQPASADLALFSSTIAQLQSIGIASPLGNASTAASRGGYDTSIILAGASTSP